MVNVNTKINETNQGFHAIIPGRNLSRQSAMQRKKQNPMKNMEKTYRSDACAAIHELASDLHDAGVMDSRTFRKFEDSCLVPARPMGAKEIRGLRLREHVSQSVFALRLNVSKSTVSKWERGENRPEGASLKLLTIVQNKGLDAIA